MDNFEKMLEATKYAAKDVVHSSVPVQFREAFQAAVREEIARMRVVTCTCLCKTVGSRLVRREPGYICDCPICGGSGYVIKEEEE